MNKFRDNCAREHGATAVEYAIIAAGVAVVIAASVGVYGTELADYFDDLYGAIFTP